MGLHELAELRAQKEVARLDYEAKRQRVLDTIRQDLADLDAEYAPMWGVVDGKIAELEEMLKRAALMRKASVAGEQLQVVYSKPRSTWDGDKLDGYAAAHPEILVFKKVGEQGSVSIQARRTK